MYSNNERHINLPFITLGCVINVSTTVERSFAEGSASPAKPPMLAPIPVGTIMTAL